MRVKWILFTWRLRHMQENTAIRIANLVPRWLVYRVAIRAALRAMGNDKAPDEVRIDEILRAWK